jgi:hypothetical protein
MMKTTSLYCPFKIRLNYVTHCQERYEARKSTCTLLSVYFFPVNDVRRTVRQRKRGGRALMGLKLLVV